MVETLFAFGVGSVVGVIFAVLGVPVPAPPTVAGVAGILGLTIGYAALSGLRG